MNNVRSFNVWTLSSFLVNSWLFLLDLAVVAQLHHLYSPNQHELWNSSGCCYCYVHFTLDWTLHALLSSHSSIHPSIHSPACLSLFLSQMQWRYAEYFLSYTWHVGNYFSRIFTEHLHLLFIYLFKYSYISNFLLLRLMQKFSAFLDKIKS